MKQCHPSLRSDARLPDLNEIVESYKQGQQEKDKDRAVSPPRQEWGDEDDEAAGGEALGLGLINLAQEAVEEERILETQSSFAGTIEGLVAAKKRNPSPKHASAKKRLRTKQAAVALEEAPLAGQNREGGVHSQAATDDVTPGDSVSAVAVPQAEEQEHEQKLSAGRSSQAPIILPPSSIERARSRS